MREMTAALSCRSEEGVNYIDGLAVPWDVEITYMGKPESFAPGGLTPASDRVVPFRYGHQQSPEGMGLIPIGRIAEYAHTNMGLWVSTRLLDVPAADHAYAAARDGIVTGFSVEFIVPGQRPGPGQGRVTNGIMTGLVLTEHPAYEQARVSALRALTPRWDAWNEWRQQRQA